MPLVAEGERSGPIDWDEVHRVVQGIFSELAGRIHLRCSSIRSRIGRTSGRSFPLFSYRSFDLAEEPEIDPVIVALSFEPTPTGEIAIRGDIGGEESGRIDFEVAERVVSSSRWDVLPTASRTAMRLGEQADTIVQAVLRRHPPPSY